MRLLYEDVGGQLALTDDLQEAPGPYGILSHTWLDDTEEVRFEELTSERARHKQGYRKLRFLLQQVKRDGLRFGWADTCCIDKKNNNELTEAINCMFTWYSKAQVCYVFLTDVPSVPLADSRWFTRGWTLQELIAPPSIEFYDANSTLLGTGESLKLQIETISGIDVSISEASPADIFGWSLQRRTKKPEDNAYCLYGLMGVTPGCNYGEGGEAARERLLRAIEDEHGRKVGRTIRQTLNDFKSQSNKKPDPKKSFEDLLKSLAFDQMFARRHDIEDPYPNTCSWFLEHCVFQQWLSKEFSFLWIKAKAGAGKSTLMRYLVTTQPRAISLFFNARGSSLEATTLGMYRSLMWQLASIAPYSCEKLEISRPWTVRTLTRALKQCILKLKEPIMFFIDALDECPTDDVQDMVYFFNDLSKLSKNFSICFASRYYPSITIKDSVEIRLDHEQYHTSDIAQFIAGRLDAEDDLQEQVLLRANGVFFWAVLVVPLLNREISSGNDHLLQERLNAIPQGIHLLLADLVADLDKKSILAFQILTFALKPLSLEEFCAALMIAHHLDTPDMCIAKLPTNTAMLERFITSCTRGFAEMTQRGVVQFIHESVRDFLLWDGGFKEIIHVGYTEAHGHELMKRICQYATNSIISGSSTEVEQSLRKYLMAQHFLQHAELACDFPQAEFLRDFDIRGYDLYVANRDWFVQWRDCGLHEPSVTLLNVLAEVDAPRLIRVAHSIGLYSCKTSLCTAICSKNAESFAALLENVDKDSTITSVLTELAKPVYEVEAWYIQRLLQILIDRTSRNTTPPNALIEALHCGWPAACLQVLLDSGISPNTRDENGNNALHVAVTHSADMEVFWLLLDYDAEIDAQNVQQRTPLHIACYHCNTEARTLLLNAGANPDIVDDQGISGTELLQDDTVFAPSSNSLTRTYTRCSDMESESSPNSDQDT